MKNLFKKIHMKKGMTYIEVIVVLSIFAVVSAVVMYNYGDFQDNIDIKNLASDVGLKVVEAQKSSLSGLLPVQSVIVDWKPSYGVYFDTSSTDNKSKFLYFVDANADKFFDGSDCIGECLSKISITKNNYIDQIKVFYSNGTDAIITNFTISFSRPDSGARMVSGVAELVGVDHVEITVASPKGASAQVVMYPSGRIEVK